MLARPNLKVWLKRSLTPQPIENIFCGKLRGNTLW